MCGWISSANARMRRVSKTQTLPDTRPLSSRWVLLTLPATIGALVVAAFVCSAPRQDVALPGPYATPEQVVRAYIDAVNARDF